MRRGPSSSGAARIASRNALAGVIASLNWRLRRGGGTWGRFGWQSYRSKIRVREDAPCLAPPGGRLYWVDAGHGRLAHHLAKEIRLRQHLDMDKRSIRLNRNAPKHLAPKKAK